MLTNASNPISPQEVWDRDVAYGTQSTADWLWPGFVARRNLTLLTSMWKSGKTTLLRENPLYEHMERQKRDLKLPLVSLREWKRGLGDDKDTGGRLWPPGSPED